MLEPGDASYVGSPFDALLPVEAGSLLVEAPGPVGLLAGVGEDVPLPDGARRVGDVLALTRDDGVVERLEGGGELPEGLEELVALDAPVAWTGRTRVGTVVVTLDGDRLQVAVQGDVRAEVERAVASGALPGSPGRRWAQLLEDPQVAFDAGRTVLTARTTQALPPTLLRQLVDQRALPPV